MRRWIGGAAMAVLWLGVCPGLAQIDNPVYADDSPLAADTLGRLDDLLSIESYAEAARVLQRLLDDEGQRVLRSPEDESLYLPVRRLVHERLLASAPLLERYREGEGARAQALVESGDWDEAERTRLLTPWGFEAALRTAQVHLEGARFHSALRTLAQLDAHPDRAGDGGREAARLLGEASRYVDDPRSMELARAWAVQSGLDEPELARVNAPPGAHQDVRSALETGASDGALDIASLSKTPLRSEALSPVDRRVIDGPPTLRDQPARQRTRQRTFAWSMPSTLGDVLYVSDGVTVSAWDRFTLGVIWQRRIGPPAGQGARDRYVEATRQRLGQGLEDSASVTIAGDIVLATSGLARSGSRQDGGSVFALDRASGRVLWSVDVAKLDEALASTSVRGPVLVDGRTAVVTARKAVRTRRLISQYFVGLDLRTGELRWKRLIASAGSLPFQTFGRLGEGGVLVDGVAFRADEIGVVAAVDADSGRPVWVRHFKPSALYSNAVRAPWNTPTPIPDHGTLILLAPDRSEVVRLDMRTGDVLARRDAESLGRPHYLMRVGGSLVMVGEDRVAFVDIRRFDVDPVRMSKRLDPISLSGRCAVSGGLVLAPTHEGVLVIDPMRPREATRIDLELTGNLLALPGQLVAVGEFEVHSYLVWDTASALLKERMRQNPSDPAPPATFAELAYRSGRHDQIAPALDQAILALRRGAPSEDNRRLRARLFAGVLGMVRSDGDEAQGDEGVTSLDVRRALTERLGRLARTPEQRVSHLMALGRLHESVGEADEAARAYQRVLSDASLAGATWRGSTLAVRAELEASRRLRRVVLAHGAGAYRAFDREAKIERDLLSPESTPEEIARIARRYPASSVAPELWVRASLAYDMKNRPHASERALRSALGSAELLDGAGAPISTDELGEIAGRLALALVDRARTGEAKELVDRARALDPAMVPTRDSVPIDLGRLASGADGAGGERALAVIGLELAPEDRPRLLTGVPLVSAEAPVWAADSVLMVSRERSELSLYRSIDGDLSRVWVRSAPGEATLLHSAPGSALIHWAQDSGGTIERISLVDGRREWGIGALGATLAAMSDRAPGTPARAQDRGDFLAPVDGAVSPRSIIHAIGEQTLVICDRAGRAAAFDLSSGRQLWTRRTRLARVHDLDVGAGVVAIGGEVYVEDAGSTPTIVALDARTGEVISPIEGVSSQVRWVRAAGSGDLIAGLNGAVVSLNVVEGRINWVMTGLATEDSRGAFLFGSTIVLVDADRALWIGDTADGRLNALELDLQDRIRATGPIGVSELGDRIVVSGEGGAAIFNRGGALVGMDALNTSGVMLLGAVTRDALALVESRMVRGRMVAQLHLLDTESAKLIETLSLPVYDAPSGVVCVDGFVLVSVGGATMVIPAPVDGE